MDELTEVVRELIEFIEENEITDETHDDGGGHIDEWRSEEFQQLIDNVKGVL